jgi:hypothetical protein
MGASSQGGQMNPQGAQIRPQQPMGRQPQQGKGPGLPMQRQDRDRPFQSQPYQPIGVNNPPFNPNPVQPTPGNMPVGLGQAKGPGQLPQGITPQMLDAFKMQQMQQMQNGNPVMGGGPMQPQVMPMNPMMQQLMQGQQVPSGKGPM